MEKKVSLNIVLLLEKKKEHTEFPYQIVKAKGEKQDKFKTYDYPEPDRSSVVEKIYSYLHILKHALLMVEKTLLSMNLRVDFITSQHTV